MWCVVCRKHQLSRVHWRKIFESMRVDFNFTCGTCNCRQTFTFKP